MTVQSPPEGRQLRCIGAAWNLGELLCADLLVAVQLVQIVQDLRLDRYRLPGCPGSGISVMGEQQVLEHLNDLHGCSGTRSGFRLTVVFPSPVVSEISLLLIPLVKWRMSTLL